MMKERGWKSKDTLEKARKELLAGGWISLTRQGGLHVPSLYGVTFFGLDYSSKLEVSAQEFPFGAWAQSEPMRQVRHPARRGTNRPTDPHNGAPAASESVN
jgi:hypothetical protein